MWMHQVFLNNGVRKSFLTDKVDIPKEFADYCEKYKDLITIQFCDHFSITTKEFLERYNKIDSYMLLKSGNYVNRY